MPHEKAADQTDMHVLLNGLLSFRDQHHSLNQVLKLTNSNGRSHHFLALR